MGGGGNSWRNFVFSFLLHFSKQGLHIPFMFENFPKVWKTRHLLAQKVRIVLRYKKNLTMKQKKSTEDFNKSL